MTDLAILIREIDAIEKDLTEAQGKLQSGIMPKLAGLEDRVGVICGKLQEAPPAIQKNAYPRCRIYRRGWKLFLRKWRFSAELIWTSPLPRLIPDGRPRTRHIMATPCFFQPRRYGPARRLCLYP